MDNVFVFFSAFRKKALKSNVNEERNHLYVEQYNVVLSYLWNRHSYERYFAHFFFSIHPLCKLCKLSLSLLHLSTYFKLAFSS